MTINRLDANGYWAVKGSGDSSYIPIYVPSIDTKITTDNITTSDTGRDESGIMHIGWVQRKLYKIQLHYKAMTDDELYTLFNKIVGQNFKFKFRHAGVTRTINAYCGASDVTLHSYGIGDEVYTDAQFNIIDVGGAA